LNKILPQTFSRPAILNSITLETRLKPQRTWTYGVLSVFLRSALYGTVVKDEFLPIDRATKKKKRDKVAASLNISMEGGP
jgi:hypothetical protein